MPYIDIGFCGGSYTARSTNINAQRCVNFFVTPGEQGGKETYSLYGTPGLKLEKYIGSNAEVRALYNFNGVLFAVINNTVNYLTAGGDLVNVGTILTASGRISIADNGSQMIIVDGLGYIWDGSSLRSITDSDFPNATTVVCIDGYFICNKPNTDLFFISDLLDGFTWDPLDFSSADALADKIVTLIAYRGELWVLGDLSTQIYYDSGDANFPFSRVGNGFLEQGCAAKWSAVAMDNTIYWLSKNKQGQGKIVRALGYTPEVISTKAVEYAIQSYIRIDDAFAFAYQENGHSFYVITFPTAERTWVYDASTSFWHERLYFEQSDTFTRYRANCYAFFNQKHYVGDYKNGKIYSLDMNTYTDDGNPIKRIRSSQHIWNDRLRVVHRRFQIEFQSGVGLNSGQGSDPVVMIDYSDDGGHTWSNKKNVKIGGVGEYKYRSILRQLGSSRDRVYRCTITDPVNPVIIGANILATTSSS